MLLESDLIAQFLKLSTWWWSIIYLCWVLPRRILCVLTRSILWILPWWIHWWWSHLVSGLWILLAFMMKLSSNLLMMNYLFDDLYTFMIWGAIMTILWFWWSDPTHRRGKPHWKHHTKYTEVNSEKNYSENSSSFILLLRMCWVLIISICTIIEIVTIAIIINWWESIWVVPIGTIVISWFIINV